MTTAADRAQANVRKYKEERKDVLQAVANSIVPVILKVIELKSENGAERMQFIVHTDLKVEIMKNGNNSRSHLIS